jgi:hypothetical protein
MPKTTKPRDNAISAKSTPPKKNEIEFDEKALDDVTGGKSCASGKHIKDGVITT